MLTNNNSSKFYQIITDKIVNSFQKKITFCEYMNLVLYHEEYGYYHNQNTHIGKEGDFYTSSSLSSDFGELLAEQFLEMWHILDKPSTFYLIEMGAGEGSLTRDILNYYSQNYPDFLVNLQYIIIEKSINFKDKQKKILQPLLSSNKINISWKTIDNIQDNSIIGCFFSNELIDAFPVHKIIKDQNELKEIYVTIKDNQLVENIDQLSTININNYFKLININLLESNYLDGYQTEVNLNALEWLKMISKKLKQGYLLTIDYGYKAEKYYHSQRSNGTLKCYYQHHHHDNPYVNLGLQDITTHVDFTALQLQGKLLNLETLGLTNQAMFLIALGLDSRLTSLSNNEKISLSDLLSKRNYLHQLINPEGLGGFQVLIQGKALTIKQQQLILKGLLIP